MFKELADAFCHSILDLCDSDQTKSKQIQDEIEQTIIKSGSLDKKDEGGKNGTAPE